MAGHPIRIFLLGVVNFAILAYVLRRLLGSAMNQFFFARRARIRKQMLSSVMNLRKARAREAQCRVNYDSLPRDMASRRAAILAQCREECSAIDAEASRRAEYMVESAERQAEEEKAKAARRVRSKLIVRAFEIARERLHGESKKDSMRRYMEEGFDALSGVSLEM